MWQNNMPLLMAVQQGLSMVQPSSKWCCAYYGFVAVSATSGGMATMNSGFDFQHQVSNLCSIWFDIRYDFHTVQLKPLPPIISYFTKIQNGSTFLVPAYPGCPGKAAVKQVLL